MSQQSRKKQAVKNAKNGHVKVNFKSNATREDEKDRRRSLIQAYEIYEGWKKSFVNTPCKWDDIPTRFNELAAKLEEGVKHEYIRKVVVTLATEGMVRSQGAAQMSNASVMVAVNCPHKITINNVQSDCPWAGMARFLRSDWRNPAALIGMDCPKCGGKIGRDDMKDFEQLVAISQN